MSFLSSSFGVADIVYIGHNQEVATDGIGDGLCVYFKKSFQMVHWYMWWLLKLLIPSDCGGAAHFCLFSHVSHSARLTENLEEGEEKKIKKENEAILSLKIQNRMKRLIINHPVKDSLQ